MSVTGVANKMDENVDGDDKLQDYSNTHTYAVKWKIDSIEHAEEKVAYNMLTLPFSRAKEDIIYVENDVQQIAFCTSRKESDVFMHCVLVRTWSWPEELCRVTFRIAPAGNDGVMEAFPCRLVCNKSSSSDEHALHWKGKVKLSSTSELPKYVMDSSAARGYLFSIICEVEIMMRDAASIKQQMNNNEVNVNVKTTHMELDSPREVKKLELIHYVTLVSAEGKKLLARKAALLASSPVFSALIDGQLFLQGKEGNVVTMKGVAFDLLVHLVKFIYTSRLEGLQAEVMFELMPIADKYQIANLRAECEEAIMQQLTVDNAIRIFDAANAHKCERLKNEAKGFISYMAQAVADTPDFENFNSSALLRELFRELAKRSGSSMYLPLSGLTQ